MEPLDNLFNKNDDFEKFKIAGKEYNINHESMFYSQQGLESYKKKDYANAITAFTKAINVQPTNQNLYSMRGAVYEDMGNDIEAEIDFRKNLEIHSTDFVAAFRLGMVYFRKKDFENAIKWLKISYNNTSGDIPGMTDNNLLFVSKKIIAGNLGNFLTQIKQYEEGIVYLNEAIKLDPKYPNPYMAKGITLARMGKINEGISCLEIAEQLGAAQATEIIAAVKKMKI